MAAIGASLPIRLITHNIRYATSRPFKGEEPWSVRRPRVIAQLKYHTRNVPTTIICLQEVLHKQLEDLLSGLNDRLPGEWTSIGVGRDDGKKAGEYSPIIYRASIWKLDCWKTIWLSETPDRPSRGWDAACIRVITVGVLQHRESKQRTVIMNTHLDDQGVVARLESARMLIGEAGRWAGYERWPASLPLLLAGDLNSTEDGDAYRLLNGDSSPVIDVRRRVDQTESYGNINTFTGFDGGRHGEELKHIDYIFLGHRKEECWTVEGYAVLANVFDDGIYLSDHRAVVADLLLRER